MFACFYVPDFPVQAALLIELPQARNVFKQSPLAILDGPANLPRVFALNQPARQAGIESGMSTIDVDQRLGTPSESCWQYSWSPRDAYFRMKMVCFLNGSVAAVIEDWQR